MQESTRKQLSTTFGSHQERSRTLLGLLLKPVPEDSLDLLLEQEVFWLRIMKEHIEFVIHLLDPSERELIEQAEEFRKTFHAH